MIITTFNMTQMNISLHRAIRYYVNIGKVNYEIASKFSQIYRDHSLLLLFYLRPNACLCKAPSTFGTFSSFISIGSETTNELILKQAKNIVKVTTIKSPIFFFRILVFSYFWRCVYLCVYLFICMCVFVCLFFCLSIVCVFMCLFICSSVCLSFCLFICLSFCLFVVSLSIFLELVYLCIFYYVCVCVFVCLLICLSICLFVCVFVCLFICLSLLMCVCLYVCTYLFNVSVCVCV